MLFCYAWFIFRFIIFKFRCFLRNKCNNIYSNSKPIRIRLRIRSHKWVNSPRMWLLREVSSCLLVVLSGKDPTPWARSRTTIWSRIKGFRRRLPRTKRLEEIGLLVIRCIRRSRWHGFRITRTKRSLRWPRSLLRRAWKRPSSTTRVLGRRCPEPILGSTGTSRSWPPIAVIQQQQRNRSCTSSSTIRKSRLSTRVTFRIRLKRARQKPTSSALCLPDPAPWARRSSVSKWRRLSTRSSLRCSALPNQTHFSHPRSL